MEYASDDDEEGEEEELRKEPSDDELLARVQRFQRARSLDTTTCEHKSQQLSSPYCDAYYLRLEAKS
jgi:hypothetical protein